MTQFKRHPSFRKRTPGQFINLLHPSELPRQSFFTTKFLSSVAVLVMAITVYGASIGVLPMNENFVDSVGIFGQYVWNSIQPTVPELTYKHHSEQVAGVTDPAPFMPRGPQETIPGKQLFGSSNEIVAASPSQTISAQEVTEQSDANPNTIIQPTVIVHKSNGTVQNVTEDYIDKLILSDIQLIMNQGWLGVTPYQTINNGAPAAIPQVIIPGGVVNPSPNYDGGTIFSAVEISSSQLITDTAIVRDGGLTVQGPAVFNGGVNFGGGLNLGFTEGSIPFQGPTGLSENNAQLYWNDADGQLGIGTNTPDASAVVDVTSTTKGFLTPRMTSVQRDAIAAPATGLLVYNTTTNSYNFYNGTSWVPVVSGSVSSAWSDITDPVANLSLSMANRTTNFTWGSATGASNLFNLSDSAGNTGNGYLITVGTAAGSSLNPVTITVNGGTPAFTINAAGNSSFGGTVAFNSGTTFQANDITDLEVSDILTSSIFVGTGSTTNAVDLGTAEVSGILAGTNGGTGVNNGASTITLNGNINTAGSFTTTGAFGLTLNQTGATNVTLPTSGTLYGTTASSISSAQLATSLSDETGTGLAVFGTNPTFSSSATFSGLSTNSAVYTDGSSGLTTTAPTSGTIGYWSRAGVTLSPATITDNISTNGNITSGADITAFSSGALQFLNSTRLGAPSNGNLLISNNAQSNFGLLQLGGTSVSFPALKRSGTGLQVRLADDSGYGTIDALGYLLNGTNINTAGTLNNVAYLNQANTFSANNTFSSRLGIGGSPNYILDVLTSPLVASGASAIIHSGTGTASQITFRPFAFDYGSNISFNANFDGTNENRSNVSYGTFSIAQNNTTAPGIFQINYAAPGANPIIYSNGLTMLTNGNVGIGTTNPSAALSVGTTSQFQVNSSGAIAAATGITSSGTITLSGLGGGGTQCLQTSNTGAISGTGIACGAGGGLTVGTTAISSGGANRVLFENGSNVLSEDANFTYDGTTLAVANASTIVANKVINISQTGATIGTDYAGYFSNTGAATTNVGLYATATGATNNYAAIFDQGNVGIGDTSPAALLTVGAGDVFQISSAGNINSSAAGIQNFSGAMLVGAANYYGWSGRSKLYSPSDGVIELANNGHTDFGRLQFGGTTASFPALKRNSAGLQARLADDSGYTTLDASDYLLSGTSINTAGTLTNVAYKNQVNTFTANNIFQPTVTSGTGAAAGLQIVANALTSGNGLDISSSSLTTGNLVALTSTSAAAGSGTQTVLNVSTSGTNSTSAQTTYGAQISNTHLGTTSTNVGLQVSVSNGTTANYAIITNGGNVGIGDTTPTALLTVGSGDLFQVNSSGAIAAATGITSSGGITFSGFSTNKGLLYTDASGVLGQTAQGAANTILHGNGTSAPSFSQIVNADITNATIDLTTKVTGVLPGTNGGTGVNNGSNTITLGGNLTTSGAFATTLTSTATTNVTLPTSGTLYGTATGSITSAQLLTSLSDETGTGVAVFGTNPTFSSSAIFSGLTASSAVYTDGSKSLTSTAPTSGTIGYWSRTGTTLQPATSNDVISVSGNTGDIATFASSATSASNKTLNVSQTGATSGTDYAGYFSNTGSATTNVGLYATATGATNNYAAIFDSGNVGIGTTAPETPLHVSGVDNFGAFSFLGGTYDIGALINPTYSIDTGHSGSTAAQSVLNMTNTTQAGAAIFSGSTASVYNTGSAALPANSQLFGSVGTVLMAGTGSAPSATGVAGFIIRQNSNTISSANGAAFGFQNYDGSGTTGSLTGISIIQPVSTVGHTITDTYGIYIADQTNTAGTQTNTPYGIYQAGTTNKNFFAGTISSPGAGASSEHFGASSTAAGVAGTAVGSSANATGNFTAAIGSNAYTGGDSSTAVGYLTSTGAGTSAIALGSSAAAVSNNSIAIGASAFINTGMSGAIALGTGATTTAANQLVIGSSTSSITSAYIGNGVTNASPANIAINATGGSGTNIAGASLTLAGGIATGNAATGDILLQGAPVGSSGAAAQTLQTYVTVKGGGASAGNVGIGDTSPAALLTVGSGDLFQVNSSGAIAAATGITSSGTINFSGLTASSAVYTDGSKNLTSTAPTSGAIGYWSRTGTTLQPATAGDNVTTNGNISTTSTGTISSSTTVSAVTSVSAPLFTNAGALSVTTTASNGNINLTPNGTGAVLIPASTKFGSDATNAYLQFQTSGNNLVLSLDGTQAIGITNPSTNGLNAYFSGRTINRTTGTSATIELNPTFSPTSGTGALATFLVDPVVNQTGSATGISRGVYVNPTLTSAKDFRANESTFTIAGALSASSVYGNKIAITNNQTTNANTVYGNHITFTDAGSVANTVYGNYVDVTTANTADTTYAAVFQGGNVGIGTTTPGAALSMGSAAAEKIRIYDSGSAATSMSLGVSSGVFQIAGGSSDIAFNTGGYNGAEAMRLISSGANLGNFGIGDSTVASKRLAVVYSGARTTTNYGTNIQNNTTNVTTDAIDKYGLYVSSTGSFTGSAGTATNNYGLYVATPTGGDNNYAAIFQGGNVGIGTTAPTQVLEVGGNILINGTTNRLIIKDGFHSIGWDAGLDGLNVKGYQGVNFSSQFGEIARITGSNFNFGGDTTPNDYFTVGSTSQFQINSSGAIVVATGIASSGTINFSGLTASSAVYTDGSKNLTSTAPTSGALGYWSRTGTLISPATSGDRLSVPGAGTSSERFGASSLAAGNNSVAIGNTASSAGAFSIAIGNAATANGSQSIALGYNISEGASGTGNVLIGSTVTSSASVVASIAIGFNASVTGTDGIALGRGATAGSNQFVVGGEFASTGFINEMYLGKGVVNAAPVAVTINATGGSGTNIAGANLSIAGGKATGNAASGDILFRGSDIGSSGATLQSLNTRMIIKGQSGNVGIGTATPSEALTIQPAGGDGVVTWGNSNMVRRATAACAGCGPDIQFMRTRGTIASPADVNAGDTLGDFTFRGRVSGSEGYWASFGATKETAGGQLNFQTGTSVNSTSTKMVIDPSGNVGIGTTGPDRKLDVLDSSNPQLRLTYTDGSIYSDLQTNASGYLNINPSGNRTIINGTNYALASGNANLIVNSTDSAAANLGGSLGFAQSGTVYGLISGRSDSAGGNPGYMTFETRDGSNVVNERMRIASTGRIGINTSTTTNGFVTINNTAGGIAGLRVDQAGGPDGGTTYGIYSAATGSATNSGTYVGGYFSASVTSAGNNYAAIFNQGNVGINTTTPTTKLEIGSSDFGNGTAGPVITLGRNNNGTATGAGSINFQQKGGTAGYVWQDAAGNMRINTAAPSNANDTAGTVIGTQTSTRETKTDIQEYNDFNAALLMVTNAPLHTFKYIKDVQGYGDNSALAKQRIGFIADEVSSQYMWGNSIDQVSVNGILMASVKALDNKITDLQSQVASLQGQQPSGAPNFSSTTPIAIKTQLYLSEDSVGEAKILPGATSVRVTFKDHYQYQPIVTATPNSRVGSEYWIDDKNEAGFTIYIDSPSTSIIYFNWHAFASEEAKLTVSDGTTETIPLAVEVTPGVAGDTTDIPADNSSNPDNTTGDGSQPDSTTPPDDTSVLPPSDSDTSGS